MVMGFLMLLKIRTIMQLNKSPKRDVGIRQLVFFIMFKKIGNFTDVSDR